MRTADAGQKPKALTQAEVDSFVGRDSKLKLLQAEHEQQKSELKPRLLAGARCPIGGPFVLEIIPQERSTVNWEQEALLMAMEMYGEEKGRAWMLKLKDKTPKTTVYSLRVKRNLKYKVVCG